MDADESDDEIDFRADPETGEPFANEDAILLRLWRIQEDRAMRRLPRVIRRVRNGMDGGTFTAGHRLEPRRILRMVQELSNDYFFETQDLGYVLRARNMDVDESDDEVIFRADPEAGESLADEEAILLQTWRRQEDQAIQALPEAVRMVRNGMDGGIFDAVDRWEARRVLRMITELSNEYFFETEDLGYESDNPLNSD